MKSIFALALLSVASISSVMADTQSSPLLCKTTPEPLGGFTSVTITSNDGETATLTGFQSGGAAHFVRNIGPYNVKVTYNADEVVYSNEEQGIEFSEVTTAIDGRILTSAFFKEGKAETSMDCQLQ